MSDSPGRRLPQGQLATGYFSGFYWHPHIYYANRRATWLWEWRPRVEQLSLF